MALLALAAGGWAYVAYQASAMGGMESMDGARISTIGGLVPFMSGWTAMMVAMMVPVTLPLILLYRVVARNRLGQLRARVRYREVASRKGAGYMAEESGEKTNVAIGKAPWRAALVGYAACAWAFLFAVAHFYWALGGCAGFPVEACEAGLSNAWFLAYDLVAGVLCVLGAATALALVRPWGRTIPRRTLLVLAWAGGAVLLLRGGVGLVQDVLILAGPGNGWYPTMFYDPWFLVGGVLFCAAAHRYDREGHGGARGR